VQVNIQSKVNLIAFKIAEETHEWEDTLNLVCLLLQPHHHGGGAAVVSNDLNVTPSSHCFIVRVPCAFQVCWNSAPTLGLRENVFMAGGFTT